MRSRNAAAAAFLGNGLVEPAPVCHAREGILHGEATQLFVCPDQVSGLLVDDPLQMLFSFQRSPAADSENDDPVHERNERHNEHKP